MRLEELIPENHFVRIVNSAIERMDIAPLVQQYKSGGTSSYHPKMMLKVCAIRPEDRICQCMVTLVGTLASGRAFPYDREYENSMGQTLAVVKPGG